MVQRMTNDERKAIKARADAATPGPWKTCPDENAEAEILLVLLRRAR